MHLGKNAPACIMPSANTLWPATRFGSALIQDEDDQLAGWLQLLYLGAMSPTPDPVHFTQAELLGAQRLLMIAQQATAERTRKAAIASSIAP
jgi:hypothetical protein